MVDSVIGTSYPLFYLISFGHHLRDIIFTTFTLKNCLKDQALKIIGLFIILFMDYQQFLLIKQCFPGGAFMFLN